MVEPSGSVSFAQTDRPHWPVKKHTREAGFECVWLRDDGYVRNAYPAWASVHSSLLSQASLWYLCVSYKILQRFPSVMSILKWTNMSSTARSHLSHLYKSHWCWRTDARVSFLKNNFKASANLIKVKVDSLKPVSRLPYVCIHEYLSLCTYELLHNPNLRNLSSQNSTKGKPCMQHFSSLLICLWPLDYPKMTLKDHSSFAN